MNDYNPEYDDEAGMADNNLETLKRAVKGIDDVISTGDNLPEWCQEKIAVAKSMLVTVWDYMRSEEERGAIAEGKKSRRDPIRTIKTKGPNKIDMEKAKKQAAKKKKKKSNYSESLDIQLHAKIIENRDMKNWDQTPSRIMPAESFKSNQPSVTVRRESDEWVVSIKGKIFRISTDDADSREEAIAIAKQNYSIKESGERVSVVYIDGKPSTKYTKSADAKKDADHLRSKFPKKNIEIKSEIKEAREMSPALRAAQQNLIALRKAAAEKKASEKSAKSSKPRSSSSSASVRSISKEPEIIARGGQVYDPEMEKLLADFLARGGEIKKGRPGKAPPVGRNQASKHIGGAGNFKRKGDKPGLGANYRGDKDVAVEGWTHDTLAAQLFEQDLTYEDILNRMLNGKLKK